MHMAPRVPFLLLLAALTACSRGPTRDEALAAIRAGRPGVDSAVVQGRVWQDGPPWFSCAEVLAKVGTPHDSAVVRDQLGNWKPLVAHGWITLRDSASGPVADPGWCTVRLTPAGQENAARWSVSNGPEFPTGQPRRGWTMAVGRQRVEVPRAPVSSEKDIATAEYLVRVVPNADGVATGADRDTARFVADLRRVDGGWQMIASRPARAAPLQAHR